MENKNLFAEISENDAKEINGGANIANLPLISYIDLTKIIFSYIPMPLIVGRFPMSVVL